MNASIFILCAGDASRFDGPIPKQLLPVKACGETILARILRQVNALGAVPCVVTNNAAIRTTARTNNAATTMAPACSRWTCETAFSTRHEWGGDFCAFLLGDVYWTDEAIVKFFDCPNEITWATDSIDLFGLRFPRDKRFDVEDLLAKVRTSLETCPAEHGGRLRELWTVLPGKEIFINDGTMDIDTMADYNRLLKGWNKRPPFVHPSRRCIAKG